MTSLANLDGVPSWAALLGGGLLVLVLWLGWRRPIWLFLLAIASLAIRPQLLWGGPEVGYDWGLHQTLFVVALALNALRHGMRTTINWPILALMATFALSLAFGDLHPKLTLPLMLESLAIFALPFAFTQVVLEPGSRRVCALTIMLTPLLSVALGGVFEALAIRPLFNVSQGVYRLEGATGNAAVFAILAFAGFAVALHGATRPGRPYAIYMALLNLALIVLSGTRMAMVSSVVLVAVYAALSPELRELARRRRRIMALGACAMAAVLLFYWPSLELRLFAAEDGALPLSGRDRLWTFYYEEFLLSPVFGRGFGTGFIAAADWLQWARTTPHNEYLHILVMGGVAGFLLCAGGAMLWYRQLLQMASPNDHAFLLAMVPALLVFAITEDVLTFSSGLAVYAYLGVVFTRPGPIPIALRQDAQDMPVEAEFHAPTGEPR